MRTSTKYENLKKGGENPLYIKRAVTHSIENEKIFLYYFTTAQKGVGIDMYIDIKGGKTLRTRKVSENLFNTNAEARAFVDVLYNSLVTPTSLQDVIDDML